MTYEIGPRPDVLAPAMMVKSVGWPATQEADDEAGLPEGEALKIQTVAERGSWTSR